MNDDTRGSERSRCPPDLLSLLLRVRFAARYKT
jgi:hypothetical protein